MFILTSGSRVKLLRNAAALVIAIAGSLGGCRLVEEKIPDNLPNPANPTLPLPVASPTAVPLPPTKSPTPPPSAPTPTPQPTPTPRTGCSLPPGGDSGQNCPRTSPSFLGDVEDGIDDAIRRHPEYFDLADSKGTGVYRIKNSPAYHDAVIQYLRSRGLCATFDGEEVAVKSTNSFNDQYDIVTSTGYVRRGDGAYESTCSPAWF